ncbi:MAG TPA: hypothetical protein VG488_08255 [Candidatus Angelobacter sp.]|jgi:hypothetical protein|nr:hypothetical protein [Candidatus Angelobacter sp.]
MKKSFTKSRGRPFKGCQACATIAESFNEEDIDAIADLLPKVAKNSRRIVGTLSFPVCSRKECHGALRDNSDITAEIIRQRRPGLLLCAGWSVPSKQTLGPVKKATQESQTVAVLETSAPERAYFRIEDGESFEMGKQLIRDSKQIDTDESCLTCLASNLPWRSFAFSNRQILLLICGEVTVIGGRDRVDFRSSATPPNLHDAVRAERVLILNPTHTRMGNAGTLQAWRRFLSEAERVYVSASNWDVGAKKVQHPSKTLHSVWHSGKCKEPISITNRPGFSYREWELPQ